MIIAFPRGIDKSKSEKYTECSVFFCFSLYVNCRLAKNLTLVGSGTGQNRLCWETKRRWPHVTIGQRVAQKRKEQGLSQEALGEALGVSRQSVYKWESDNALPEIDKLIAMSRLFGVTVGWLLGVEEPSQAEEQTAAPPQSEPELTEAQLKMVEEIVDRYLAARQPPKKRRWPWVAGAAAGLALLAALVSLRGDLRNMRNEYSSLQNSILFIDRNVQNQIGSITNQVEEVLKSQNSLAADFGTEVASADLAANNVTFSVYATPKTYTGGMTAVFVADNGVEPVEVSAGAGAGQEFSARLTCELTDSITLSVVFVTGDIRENQMLAQYSYLYSNSLPDVPWPEGDMDRIGLNDAGELCWPGYKTAAYLPNVSAASSAAIYDFGRAEARSIRVGLFRNRKLLGWLEPCEQPEFYQGSWSVDFYRFPEVSVVPEEGDVFQLCTVVVDEYGREFVHSGVPYVLEQGSETLVQAQNWDGVSLSGPEGWEY